MHLQYLFLALISIIYGAGASLCGQIPFLTADPPGCDCNGANQTNGGPKYVCGDKLLGPVNLPKSFPFFSLTSEYDRFAGLTPGQFLKKYRKDNGQKWAYPTLTGFLADDKGHDIKGNMTIRVGTMVDRFGNESGRYISAADAPFNQRSIPPEDLDTYDQEYPDNYRLYNVTKEIYCEGGLIAPGFGQPGLGTQFFLGARRVKNLTDDGSLTRVDLKTVKQGPVSSPCDPESL